MTALSAIPLRGLVVAIGLVLPGISIFTIVYYRFREERYLAMIAVAAVVAVQLALQLAMVLTGAYAGNLPAAMQLHRLTAVATAFVLPAMLFFLSVVFDHVPRLTRVNRVLAWIGWVVAVVMLIIAFVAPERFVSVTRPNTVIAADSLIDQGRGETGIVYLVRNAILMALAAYAAIVAIVDFVKTDERRYVGPIAGGLVIAALLGLDDLYRVMTGSYSGFFTHQSFSRFGVGFSVLVLCATAALVDRFVRRAKQVRSLRIDLTRDEKAVERFAFTDSLTGLRNGACLDRDLSGLVPAGVGTAGGSVALSAFDIERFRLVNASYGTSRGDRCLRIVASRLTKMARSNEQVYRMSATKFALLINGVTAREAATRAREVAAVVAEPIVIDSFTIMLSVRSGVALAPEHATHAQQLVRRCEAAAAASTSIGAPVVVYDEELRIAAERYGEIVRALHRAVEEDQFGLVFQPIMGSDRSIVAAEALLRWRDPHYGVVSPGEFIPIAEDVGLIVPITRLVVGKLVHAMLAARDLGVELPLSMNLSAKELRRPNPCADLLAAMVEKGLDPGQVRIEVTESAVMRDLRGAADALRSIVDSGFQIALDDFGTGHSSFAYLSALPVHELKVDQAFMRDYPADSGAAAMVRSVIELAHGLGLTVVAEGIEHAEQADNLSREGCDFMQGYHFHKPMPLEELLVLLR